MNPAKGLIFQIADWVFKFFGKPTVEAFNQVLAPVYILLFLLGLTAVVVLAIGAVREAGRTPSGEKMQIRWGQKPFLWGVIAGAMFSLLGIVMILAYVVVQLMNDPSAPLKTLFGG